jgi:hypothetical protein
MKEWFFQERVALIGNAESLFSKTYGAEIDSHDVVVRLNKAAMLYDRFDVEKSHGTKTHVWMFWRTAEYNNKFNLIDKSIKKMHMGHQDRHRINMMEVDHVYPNSLYTPLKKIAGKHNNPTTGFMAIDYILNCEPELLSIYGFDWKETPTFTDPDRKKEKMCPHDFETEKQYCLEHVLTKSNVLYRN